MDKRLIVNLIKWILRVLAAIMFIFMCLFFVGAFEVEGWPVGLTVSEIVMFVGMGMMIMGLVVFWFHELLAGIVVLSGYLIFVITNMISSGKFFSGWIITIFLILGVLFLITWFMKKSLKKGE